MKKIFFVFFTLSLSLLFAQEPLTIEQLIGLKKVGNPVVSPDGKYICYAQEITNISQNKGFKDLILLSIDHPENPVFLTNTPEVSEFQPVFNAVGTHIYYISNVGGVPQLYIMELNSKKSRKITEISEGIENFTIDTRGKNY